MNSTPYEKALAAINEVFEDSSVPVTQTAGSLQGLIDEIELKIGTLNLDDESVSPPDLGGFNCAGEYRMPD